MERRRLGRSGLTVPVLGWGTVKIGRNTAVKYPGSFDLPTEDEVEELVDVALELGLDLFDTAPAYGLSEERLGRALKGRRDHVTLVTKAGETFEDGASHHDFRAAALRESVERSLQRLGTDHVDLLLLHSDGQDRRVLTETDAVEGLLRLRAEGKTRAVGISAKTAEGVSLGARMLDVVMAPASRGDRSLLPALREAAEAGCGILAIKVFGQGHAMSDEGDDALRSHLDFILSQPFVHAAIAGSRRVSHLRQWVATLAELGYLEDREQRA